MNNKLTTIEDLVDWLKNWSQFNPLRPIVALVVIIDSTYSRRHKKCKKCSRNVKSSLIAKDDFI